jgi:Rtf2 RING-finger
MCGLGRLYSKQNVIEQLLEKDGMPEEFSHIKSMKDIKNLRLTENPAYSAEDEKNAPFICALIGLEMSGQFRFVAPWTCGCVFSERALKQIKASVCSICQTPYSEQDVVILNGNEEDVNMMRTKMESRAARLKAEKRDKKNKNKLEAIATATSTEPAAPSSSADAVIVKTEPGTSSEKPKLFSKSSPMIRTSLQAQKRELITDVIGSDPHCKKGKKDYSVAKDPTATEVYKSIFTTHESEQSQERAHWVTYNPFYN